MMLKDNKGLSLIELIVVLAIMAVLLGGAGLGISMLVGVEAKRGAYNINAELNDIKTGALSHAGEVMYVYYIDYNDVNADGDPSADQSVYAKAGAEKPGFYGVKRINTIDNKKDIKVDLSEDSEYSRLASNRVSIKVVTDTKTYNIRGKSNSSDSDFDEEVGAFRIEFNRRTGAIENIGVGAKPSGMNKPEYSSFSDAGEVKEIIVSNGIRKYTIELDAKVGTHKIVN